MKLYQQRPIKAVQWFPGVAVEGVSEMQPAHFRNDAVRGYCPGGDTDLWFDPGDWLVLGDEGVERVIPAHEFAAQYFCLS
jgi:hypothetical protein